MAQAHRFAGLSRPTALIATVGGACLWTLKRIQIVDSLPDQGYFSKYIALAQRVLAGDLPVDRLGDLSAGYLWTITFLSGPGRLEVPAIRALQIVLVTAAALFCGAMAARRWGDVAGLATVGLILLNRAVLLNATEIEPETIIFSLAAAALALVVGGETVISKAGAAFLLGLAAVFRPSTVLPAALMAVAVVYFTRPRTRLRTAAAIVAGFAAPLLIARVFTFILIGFWPPPMNPGTVFYEGWNPAATGYLGEAPAIVKDVEHGLGLPDGLHVAYRTVAARATGESPSPAAANRFWAARALAYIRNQPMSAMCLLTRKGIFSLHSHDAWDLATLPRKSAALPRWPWVPFGFAVALAGLGMVLARKNPISTCLALFAVGGLLVMVLFYVTARQRNLVVPAVAFLGGLAIHEVLRRWRSGFHRSIALAVSATVAAGTALTIPGTAQKEDVHTWNLRFAAEQAVAEAARANAAGRPYVGDAALARAATCLDRNALLAVPVSYVQRQVRAEFGTNPSPQRRFDLALVMAEIGQVSEATQVFEGLEANHYRPRRGARFTSSVAYHLARCRLALGDREGALNDLQRALEEAPGEAQPLALYALMVEASNPLLAASSERALYAMHDPFTARLASARAYRDLGRQDLAVSAENAVDAALADGAISRTRAW